MSERLEFQMVLEGQRQVQQGLQDTAKATGKLKNSTEGAGRASGQAAKKGRFFRRSVKDSGDEAKRASGKFRGMGKAVGAVAIAWAGYKAGGELRRSIDDAKDAQEVVSKVGTLFGSSSASMEKWGEGAAKTLGMSKVQALDAASSFAVFGQTAGLNDKEVSGFARGLTRAAGDLASFHNALPEQALGAVRSALSGEAEPLKRFGVLMNEASVSAAAMEMGLVKATRNTHLIKAAQLEAREAAAAYGKAVKEQGPNSEKAIKAGKKLATAQSALDKATKGSIPQLTEQQKVLARHHVVMKGLGAAEGDRQRTRNSAANQEKELTAQIANQRVELGEKLLPAYNKGLKVMNRFVGGMANGTGAGGKFMSVLRGIGGVLAKGTRFVRRHQDAIVALSAGLIAGVAAFQAYMVISKGIALMKAWRAGTLLATAAQMGLNTALIANPIGLVIAAIVGMGVALVVAYKKVDWFRKAVDTAWGGIKKGTRALGKTFGSVWGGVKSGFGSMIDWIQDKWNSFARGINKGISAVSGLPGVPGDLPNLPTFDGGGGGRGAAASTADRAPGVRGVAAGRSMPAGSLGGKLAGAVASSVAHINETVILQVDRREIARAVKHEGQWQAARA